MDRKIAVQNLKELSIILAKNNVRSFLVYGTCLGAVREENIIEHDNDTDLGIMAEDWNFDLLRQFIEAGFRIDFIFGMFRFGCEIALMKNDIKTDLMFFYKDEAKGYYWNALWEHGCSRGEKDMIKHVYPLFYFNYFSKIKLDGEDFYGPCDCNDYLSLVYGANWMTPVKEFNWKTDHKCKEHE